LSQVLILLGSASDLGITEDGLSLLKRGKVSFSLRVASAHRTPQHVHELVKEFLDADGQVFICVAGMSAHLAGVVAGLSTRPVIAVPVSRAATAGLDSLLSVSQMPGGIPVATTGLDKAGFTNACLFAAQILALSDTKLDAEMKAHRRELSEKTIADDRKNGIRFDG